MMEIQLFDKEVLIGLHVKADDSRRILNTLEPCTHAPIHRHLKTSETVICLEGSLEWIFYEELPNMDAGGPTYGPSPNSEDAETAIVESNFKETARFRLCPREGTCGIQIPLGTWHSVIVHEPSSIIEVKDGPLK